jgi:NSS family neurotransmitter:Na+ symporter
LTIIGCAGSLIFTSGISSYLVGIVDAFLNQFAILALVAVQCVIFGWSYGVEKLIPVLNEKSILKVGFMWTNVIKYILPVLIAIMWIIGAISLFENSTSFKIMVNIAIFASLLVISAILYKIKPQVQLKNS